MTYHGRHTRNNTIIHIFDKTIFKFKKSKFNNLIMFMYIVHFKIIDKLFYVSSIFFFIIV